MKSFAKKVLLGAAGLYSIAFLIHHVAGPDKSNAGSTPPEFSAGTISRPEGLKAEKPATHDVSAIYGRWRSSDQVDGCVSQVTEYRKDAWVFYNYNQAMRDANMVPMVIEGAVTYTPLGDVVFARTTANDKALVSAYRPVNENKIETVTILKSDGSRLGYVFDGDPPPTHTLKAGAVSGGMVKCGAEADRFIASFEAAKERVSRHVRQARHQIDTDRTAKMIHDLTWMHYIDKKCNFLAKDYLNNKYNQHLFDVTAGTLPRIKGRFEDVIYLEILRHAEKDAKIDTCLSPHLKQRFWALWEKVRRVGQ